MALKPVPKAAPAMIKMESVPINSVRSHPKNPRLHNEENLQAIMRSLQEFGQNQAIVTWGPQNWVIVGNGRLEAMRRLGKQSVLVIKASHLSEDQALSYMIADNKTTDMSTFDNGLLSQILQGLSNQDQLLDASGFNRMEIEPLLTADLPSAPEDMDGLTAPDGVADLDDKGSSDALGRVILVFDSKEQREVICKHLGLDPEQNTKQTFSFQEIPAFQVVRKPLPPRRLNA